MSQKTWSSVPPFSAALGSVVFALVAFLQALISTVVLANVPVRFHLAAFVIEPGSQIILKLSIGVLHATSLVGSSTEQVLSTSTRHWATMHSILPVSVTLSAFVAAAIA